jgi:hypothetical protein
VPITKLQVTPELAVKTLILLESAAVLALVMDASFPIAWWTFRWGKGSSFQ